MSRNKAKSVYTGKKQLPVRHCKQDVACAHCCSCWDKYQKEYDQKYIILNQNINKLKQENESLNRANQILTAQNTKLNKIKKQINNVEDTKNQLRQEIIKDIEKNKKAQQIILHESLKYFKQRTNQLIKQLQESSMKNKENEDKIREQDEALRNNEIEINNLKESLQRKCEQTNQKQLALTELRSKNQQMRKDNANKSETINKLQKAINQCQNNYIMQKTKAENYKFQKRQALQEIKVSNNLIENLKKDSQQKLTNISNLQTKTQRLNEMVKQRDILLYEHSLLQNTLKDRIIHTEDYAALKQRQLRQVEWDYQSLKRYI